MSISLELKKVLMIRDLHPTVPPTSTRDETQPQRVNFSSAKKAAVDMSCKDLTQRGDGWRERKQSW